MIHVGTFWSITNDAAALPPAATFTQPYYIEHVRTPIHGLSHICYLIAGLVWSLYAGWR